jgi:arginyl-tRNA synthetase
MAYQLWKGCLLDQDFKYDLFDAEGNVWVTASSGGRADHRPFGHGHTVYNVIDVRQSYLQNVVKQGLLGLGYEEQARRSIHFSYEVVALTPACAEQLGIELSPEDRKRAHIEVSGRKGQGVKADDLLNILETEAKREVAQRNRELTPAEIDTISRQIAVGALRYFLLKFTRTAIIAFDFKEALNFDGETGPYIQYAAVRANNIMHKVREADPAFDLALAHEMLDRPMFAVMLNESHDIWELLYMGLRLDEIGHQVIVTLEPATLAKYAFGLAQQFNLFYHRYRILTEEDPDKRLFYILVVDLVRETLTKALDQMGIEVPRRM